MSMSAAARPAMTAAAVMGMERNRSVTPLAASALTAVRVAPIPNTIVTANMPGRGSRGSHRLAGWRGIDAAGWWLLASQVH